MEALEQIEIKKKGKRKQERVDPKTIDERFILDFTFSKFQKDVIKLVYEMRILSTSQIADISGLSIKYIREQLLILYKNGFLYRTFPEYEIGTGSKEAFWMLDRGGALFMAGAYGVSMKALNWDIRDNLIRFEKLAHSIKITEVRTNLEVAARNLGHKIENCLSDRHLYFDFKYQDKKIILRPDMVCSYNDGKKIYQYFFEIDMGTMSINGPKSRTSNVISKVPKYESFKVSGAWKNYFEVYPRTIFITTTKSRALYMCESISNNQETKTEFLFTTFEFFKKDSLGRIYKKSDGSDTNLFE